MSTPVYLTPATGGPTRSLRYTSAQHDEDLDGTDKLVVRTPDPIGCGDMLLWMDASELWREHVVDKVTEEHRNGGLYRTAECSNSVNELFGTEASGTVLEGTAEDILIELLQGTRWGVGDCSMLGHFELEVWHKSIRAAIKDLVDMAGAEWYTVIGVEGGRVASRDFVIARKRGLWRAARQFTYGHNMGAVKREVDATQVYTRVKGYGQKADEEAEGDYAPRLTVEAVADEEHVARWGVPQADGTMGHRTLVYTDAQCTDQAFLQGEVDQKLEQVKEPRVYYEFEATPDTGDEWGDVWLGTTVLCLDRGFDPPLEIRDRVSRLHRELAGKPSCKISIGHKPNRMIEQFRATDKTAKERAGNVTSTYAYTPVRTSGGASFSGSGGDGVAHFIDGVQITSGRISFSTTGDGGSEPGPSVSPDDWGA